MECKPPKAPTRRWKRLALFLSASVLSTLGLAPAALAAGEHGGEANLILPDLGQVSFHGISGSSSWRWD